jgi:hypothetical protein
MQICCSECSPGTFWATLCAKKLGMISLEDIDAGIDEFYLHITRPQKNAADAFIFYSLTDMNKKNHVRVSDALENFFRKNFLKFGGLIFNPLTTVF